MTGPVRGRFTLRCSSCQATVYSSDAEPHPDPVGRLREFADAQCPRGGTSGGCPNTTQARDEAAERTPARLVARLREAWDTLRDLQLTRPRTVVVPVPDLPAGRHDLEVTWPQELPAAPRVQVTPEVPRAGVAALRVAILAGSRTPTGCVIVLDTSAPIPAGQAWLHVTATP